MPVNQGTTATETSDPKGRKRTMIRNAFVVMMAVAGASSAATALVALGWWNVRGDQAPATALGIALVLLASAMGAAALGCLLYPKYDTKPAAGVAAPAASVAGPGS